MSSRYMTLSFEKVTRFRGKLLYPGMEITDGMGIEREGERIHLSSSTMATALYAVIRHIASFTEVIRMGMKPELSTRTSEFSIIVPPAP